MKLEPLLDRVIVKNVPMDRMTKGGIHIPENARKPQEEAEVISVGVGKLLKDGSHFPMDVKVGDRVTFHKNTGTTVRVDGMEYLILREDDLLCVLEKD